MSDVLTAYRRVADGFESRLRGVRPEQWSAATPCEDWDVRALAAHVVSTHRRVLANLDSAAGVDVDDTGDLAAQWTAARADMEAALGDPERAEQIVGGIFGEQPFERLVGRLVCTDTLVHTWDLARATGQDERLDADAVRNGMEFLQPIDDAIRRPGGFAAKIEPPADADEQTRFLNFCGRPG